MKASVKELPATDCSSQVLPVLKSCNDATQFMLVFSFGLPLYITVTAARRCSRTNVRQWNACPMFWNSGVAIFLRLEGLCLAVNCKKDFICALETSMLWYIVGHFIIRDLETSLFYYIVWHSKISFRIYHNNQQIVHHWFTEHNTVLPILHIFQKLHWDWKLIGWWFRACLKF